MDLDPDVEVDQEETGEDEQTKKDFEKKTKENEEKRTLILRLKLVIPLVETKHLIHLD